MASPTVTVYKSTDAGAPILTGSIPTGVINILDKCLVTGYGTKVAAGWTKPFTGTNLAAFRGAGGNRFYLRVLEDQAGYWDTYSVSLIGYETMTAISTGTGLFPASGEAGVSIVDNSGIARPWVVVADDRTVYAFFDHHGLMGYASFVFGDIYSYVTSDSYRTILAGGLEPTGGLGKLVSALANTSEQHIMARKYDGTGAALTVGLHGDVIKYGTVSLSGNLLYPNASDSKIWLAPVYIHESAEPTVRGKLRGFWHWLHPLAGIGDQDTFPGAGDLAGKTFLIIRDASIVDTGGSSGSLYGAFVIETSSTWDTN